MNEPAKTNMLGAPAVRAKGGLARLARLTRKELRETLRDRRTLFTLVLMPILVYPVLSLAFQQFLLSSFQQTAEMQWIVGVESEIDYSTLHGVLSYAEAVLKQSAPSVPLAPPLATAPLAGGEPSAAEPSLGAMNGRVVVNLEESVRKMDIDLGVRIKQRAGDEEKHFSRRRYDFELFYRSNTPLSRQSAQFVERRLRAVNEAELAARLQRAGLAIEEPAQWTLKPVADEEGDSYWMATLVPLILILMTITGAVYPAIDLTAGERERGTLEALMAAPVPRLQLLGAKFVAVLTVALLTAVINLVAMTLTLQSGGLGKLLFGEHGLSVSAVLEVFALLVLFAAFFSALLLTVTSFARSFKEAQAYLIPLVMVSLGPGFLSLMPGLSLNGVLAVTPLANIVLLARDVLKGTAEPLPAFVAVFSTLLYALAALTLAARVFGNDAVLYGSQGSWSDLVRGSDEQLARPSVSGAAFCAALVYPSYFILSGYLGLLRDLPIGRQILGAGALTVLLFALLPILVARWQHVSPASGFQLRRPAWLAFAGAIVLGAALWPLAMEVIILIQKAGLASLNEDAFKRLLPGVENTVDKWRTMPAAAILLALAVAPAVCEELFFRGYLLGAFRGRMPAWMAIGLTAGLFGFFHLSVGGLMAVERVASSTLLGLVLGWICYRTHSVWPGIVLHTLHNGLMLSLVYWSVELKKAGVDMPAGQHLPPLWLVGAFTATAVGLALVWLATRTGTKS